MWISIFQARYDLDYKTKVVSLNDLTLEIYSDINPISHWGDLTLFQSPGNLDEYFLGLV